MGEGEKVINRKYIRTFSIQKQWFLSNLGSFGVLLSHPFLYAEKSLKELYDGV